MRHYYTIIDYDASDESFKLKDSDGEIFHSYLWELETDLSPNQLTGKKISVSYLKSLVYDAVGVKIEE